jgi:N-ethylmaleimide reductase
MSRPQHLFQPGRIGKLELPNRIVMAPMTRARASADAVPTGMMITYYEQRASAGLIISEGTIVSPEATGYIKVPGLFTPEQVASWRPVTDAVHARGGRIFTQLWHVGRISHPDLLGGALPLAPSAIDAQFQAYTNNGQVATVTPRAMTHGDIRRTIDDFRIAALNAIDAGFDGVELHAANSYLIHQFLVPSANQRTDDYGGSVENRARFLLEVVDTVTEAIGADRVGVRLNPCMDGVAGIVLDAEAHATYDHAVRALDARGIAFVHLTALMIAPGLDSPERTIVMSRRYRALFSGPLIVNAALTRDTAEAALAEGVADFVAFGRPFVSNPDLVERFRQNLPLAEPDAESLYNGGAAGYVDYPPADTGSAVG